MRGQRSTVWQAIVGGVALAVLALGLLSPAALATLPGSAALDGSSIAIPAPSRQPCANALRADLTRCFGQACQLLPAASVEAVAYERTPGRRLAPRHDALAASCGDWRPERPPRVAA